MNQLILTILQHPWKRLTLLNLGRLLLLHFAFRCRFCFNTLWTPHPPFPPARDVILLLWVQSHADLPITLVLGLSTSPAILDQLLPGPCLSLLQPHTFHLASAPSRVDALLTATLLGPQFPGWLPSAELLQQLDDHFLQHDYTVKGAAASSLQCMQLHFARLDTRVWQV